MTRSEEILNAVREALRQLDNWMLNLHPSDSKMFPKNVILSIQNAVLVCQTGDIPVDMQQLAVIAMPKLGEELEQYLRKADGSIQPNGTAGPAFWKAAKDCVGILHHADTVCVEQIESVQALIDQKVTREQIARSIYGVRGVGPFMLPGDRVNYALLDQEAKNPGSVIPKDWVHPSKMSAVKQRQAELKSKEAAYERLQMGPRRYEDPSTVEEMLMAGAFVQQIEKGKNVTREHVLEVAAKIGVNPVDGPEFRRPISLVKQTHTEPPEIHSGSTPAPNLDSAPSANDQGVYDSIVAVFEGNPTFGTPEIIAQLKEEGLTVSRQKVASVLAQHKAQEKSSV